MQAVLPRLSGRVLWPVVAGIIVPQAILTVLVVHRESPTYDEGDHMFAGWVANYKGSLDSGWDYPNIWMAPLRLTVSFVLGLWLYRIHDRVRMPKIGLLLLSIVLVVCFQMPKFPKAGALDWNGLYEAACVLFLFPFIILCGAHSDAGKGMIWLCKFSGRLSYPLYITHIGFVYVLAGYAWTQHPSPAVIISWIFVVLPMAIAVAWLFLKFFDEPVRVWLTRRYGIKRATA